MYKEGKIEMLHTTPNDFLYGAEIQKVFNIDDASKDLSKKLKSVYSITNILPL
jgi:hypothetical protein